MLVEIEFLNWKINQIDEFAINFVSIFSIEPLRQNQSSISFVPSMEFYLYAGFCIAI